MPPRAKTAVRNTSCMMDGRTDGCLLIHSLITHMQEREGERGGWAPFLLTSPLPCSMLHVTSPFLIGSTPLGHTSLLHPLPHQSLRGTSTFAAICFDTELASLPFYSLARKSTLPPRVRFKVVLIKYLHQEPNLQQLNTLCMYCIRFL